MPDRYKKEQYHPRMPIGTCIPKDDMYPDDEDIIETCEEESEEDAE